MARRSPHKKPIPSPAAPAPSNPFPVGLLVAIGAVLLLGGIPFALGKYIELNSPDPFDGGAYVYSAQRLLTGARLWVDEHSSAQPGTLLCNVLGVKLFGFRDVGPNLIQMLLQIGGLAMLFYTVRRLFGNPAAAVSTSLAAIMLSAPIVAKFGNVKEQFMIPFAIVAACAFALHIAGGKKHWAVITGAAAILPFYFKPTGIAVVCAIGPYLMVKLIVDRATWKTTFLTIALACLGAAIGLIVPAGLYFWQNGMERFWRTFPVVLLEGIILFSAIGFAGVAMAAYLPWKPLGTALRSVNRRLWIIGLTAIILMLAVSLTIISLTDGVKAQSDLPAYLRAIPCVRLPMQGAAWINNQAARIIRHSGILSESGYVGLSRKAVPLAEQAPKVLRYYHAVGAVTWPALATLLLLVGHAVSRGLKKQHDITARHAIAGFLAVWWIVDMTLVWVSPHSYEQYYLPLCASGAMLIAYAVWRWQQWLTHSTNNIPAAGLAGVAAIALFVLIVPVFAGFAKSPDTGNAYTSPQTGQPERRRGFAQSLATVRKQPTAPWQAIGDHIRANSTPDETLYVWGWFPGIYVRAERMAPVPRAYLAEMHITPPPVLTKQINTLVERLEKNPPKFIVDSLKRHFPFDRPPFELWPVLPPNTFGNPQPRLLGADPREIEPFENAYAAMLRQRFGDDEALRFDAMKPFRSLVMTRYRFVGQFGSHRLYEFRTAPANPTP